MGDKTKLQLETKIHELEQWLVNNPGHLNTVEVQADLREAQDELKKRSNDE